MNFNGIIRVPELYYSKEYEYIASNNDIHNFFRTPVYEFMSRELVLPQSEEFRAYSHVADVTGYVFHDMMSYDYNYILNCPLQFISYHDINYKYIHKLKHKPIAVYNTATWHLNHKSYINVTKSWCPKFISVPLAYIRYLPIYFNTTGLRDLIVTGTGSATMGAPVIAHMRLHDLVIAQTTVGPGMLEAMNRSGVYRADIRDMFNAEDESSMGKAQYINILKQCTLRELTIVSATTLEPLTYMPNLHILKLTKPIPHREFVHLKDLRITKLIMGNDNIPQDIMDYIPDTVKLINGGFRFRNYFERSERRDIKFVRTI